MREAGYAVVATFRDETRPAVLEVENRGKHTLDVLVWLEGTSLL